MLEAKRHSEIISSLEINGVIRTIDLAHNLDVTEQTVRRDLEKLEQHGKLIRTHGGAMMNGYVNTPRPLSHRQSINTEEKALIAETALTLIEPEDILLLDGSSTALHLAKALPDIPLTIITNVHALITTLTGKNRIKIICTGGEFDAESSSYGGPMTIQSIERYNIHKMFFSCTALDFELGMSEENNAQAYFKESIIKRAEKVVLLMDHSKFNTRARYFIGGLDDVDIFITDEKTPPEELEKIRKHPLELRIAS